ncbi:4211_t:CDS:2 [Gigaspora margarita]|uniref:4211_t:CDS:1 n=1 Tax=Gigaspora margarita TaxID=4874 RepID=A0ABN7U2K2_GIGMA|nr:4211_t:CDS:2 [Gigaspora margarita]
MFKSSTYYKESLKNDEKEILFPKEIAKKLYENIVVIGHNEYFENETLGIDFECDIILDDIRDVNDSPQKISRNIADLIGNNLNQQRDREPMEQFDCGGTLRITINIMTDSAFVYLKHETLHRRPERNRVNEEIKNKIKENLRLAPSDIYSMLEQDFPEITQKQILAWWTIFIQKEFIRDANQVKSAKLFLEEYNLQVIMFNNDNRIKLLGFITPFFEKFKKNKKVFVDATYKTNVLGYELYSIIGQYDSVGFAMAYLFVEGNKQDDNSQPKRIIYSSYDAHNSFTFIDVEFYPTELQKNNFCFCPKNLRSKVISIMELHMHLHPLIPNLEGIFKTKGEI